MRLGKRINRRQALQSLGGWTLVPLMAQIGSEGIFASNAHTHPRVPIPQGGEPWTPRYFSLPQNETVTQLAELIIPETETPGARSAKVHEYIDFVLSQESLRAQEQFLRGLQWLDQKSTQLFDAPFVQLTAQQQTALLTKISSRENPNHEDPIGMEFFRDLKRKTVEGYYTSAEGIQEELQYPGNLFLLEFQGCTHLEHLEWEPPEDPASR